VVSVIIRKAAPADASAVSTVAAETFGLACPPHTTEAAKAAFIAKELSPDRFADYLADPDRALFVAVVEGEFVGYTMLIYRPSVDPEVIESLTREPTAELSKCYVVSTHHTAGVAAQLISASIADARERGYAAMWLGVNEENTRAQRFYGKHEFERVGSKHFLVGDVLENDWVMERAL
jgi:diamine N-acetyltransferase